MCYFVICQLTVISMCKTNCADKLMYLIKYPSAILAFMHNCYSIADHCTNDFYIIFSGMCLRLTLQLHYVSHY